MTKKKLTDAEWEDVATDAIARALQERRPATWRAVMNELTDTERRQVDSARMRAVARRDKKR
ncbi:hypothetical protein ACFXJ8_39205 [Nonomuraea sp. NPDC059194]|uniref:hypothetical protein n=1 Tax=Nonomuraea sp. NPDC059194 TaxID=3346764 RepID=UPI00369E2B59